MRLPLFQGKGSILMKMAIRNKRDGSGGRLQLLIFPVLLLLMIVAVLLVMNFITSETQTELGVPVFQYFLDQRTEYTAQVKLLTGEDRVIFEEDGQQNESDATPIYTKEGMAFFLPADMSWMDPETGVEWRLSAFARIERDENGDIWYSEGDTRVQMRSGLLSDGQGTYVFLDDVTLMFNNLAYSMGPFSFYSNAKGLYRIYRYEEDELLVEEQRTSGAAIRTQRGYQADLTAGIYTAANGIQRLLSASPVILRDITEREASAG